MKKLLTLSILLLTALFTVSALPQQSKGWEYKIEQKCFDENRINSLGSEGWELAGYNEGDHGGWHCIFKRPKN